MARTPARLCAPQSHWSSVCAGVGKQAGLILVSGMAEGGQAIHSGKISAGDILTMVGGEPLPHSGISVEQVVQQIGASVRPLTLVFSTTVPEAAPSEPESEPEPGV